MRSNILHFLLEYARALLEALQKSCWRARKLEEAKAGGSLLLEEALESFLQPIASLSARLPAAALCFAMIFPFGTIHPSQWFSHLERFILGNSFPIFVPIRRCIHTWQSFSHFCANSTLYSYFLLCIFFFPFLCQFDVVFILWYKCSLCSAICANFFETPELLYNVNLREAVKLLTLRKAL